ncbi:MAG: hypothetical protein AAGI72_15575 [Pseudomonadota bacterium]
MSESNEGTAVKDLTLADEPLANLEPDFATKHMHRLLFVCTQDDEPGSGFHALAVDLVSRPEDVDHDQWWRAPEARAERVFEAYARFDGVSDMYWGDQYEGGYLDSPDLASLLQVLSRVHELEKKHCRDAPG